MSAKVVLYVEDEEDDAIFMRLAFSRNGSDVDLRVVVSGQEAINYLAGEKPYSDRLLHPLPALVLLDLNLPLVSGFEVLKWIRQEPEHRTLPVVIFSSSGRLEDKTRALELGADHYIQKPSSGLRFTETARHISRHILKAGS
jgi:CheY-like chemotaxis protein